VGSHHWRLKAEDSMDIKLIAVGSRPWELWTKQWGLSFLIGDNILFDTFANSRVLFKRAKRANVDLEKIQTVVISHDHWDHVGGLWKLLERRQGMDVYLPSSARDGVKSKIRTAGGHVLDGSGVKTLRPDIFVTDEFMGKFDGKAIPEQALVLKSDKGVSVIAGCSHPNILTIVRNVKQVFDAPVYGVVGGFHLMSSSLDDVHECASALKDEGIGLIAPTHCTGWRAERAFKEVFGESCVFLREGQLLSL
jgi:7,8-dihydropterin-6-yl-methyl-4-(beta-D-ribofuranosyl)aminobenzene 5'-phosphate synthase